MVFPGNIFTGNWQLYPADLLLETGSEPNPRLADPHQNPMNITMKTIYIYIVYIFIIYPIGSMYAIYGNIYHQYTPNVSIYTIHGSYGYIYIYRNINWEWSYVLICDYFLMWINIYRVVVSYQQNHHENHHIVPSSRRQPSLGVHHRWRARAGTWQWTVARGRGAANGVPGRFPVGWFRHEK